MNHTPGILGWECDPETHELIALSVPFKYDREREMRECLEAELRDLYADRRVCRSSAVRTYLETRIERIESIVLGPKGGAA